MATKNTLTKKTLILNGTLHQALKIRAAKENTTLEALVSTMLWHGLGGVVHDSN